MCDIAQNGIVQDQPSYVNSYVDRVFGQAVAQTINFKFAGVACERFDIAVQQQRGGK